MKISWFVRDPLEKRLQFRTVPKIGRAILHFDELAIRKSHVQGAMADRMHRHDFAAAPALGSRMMPFDAPAERSAAEPTRRILSRAAPLFRRFGRVSPALRPPQVTASGTAGAGCETSRGADDVRVFFLLRRAGRSRTSFATLRAFDVGPDTSGN